MYDSKEPLVPEVVRRAILDDLLMQDSPIEGRANLTSFLRRAWNLRELPSTDHRFENAEGDIWQHMVNNSDWTAEYLYATRLGILDCPDPQFVKFLEAVLHPFVRESEEEQEQYASIINARLEPLGMQFWTSR